MNTKPNEISHHGIMPDMSGRSKSKRDGFFNRGNVYINDATKGMFFDPKRSNVHGINGLKYNPNSLSDAKLIMDTRMPLVGSSVANAAERALESVPPDKIDDMIDDVKQASGVYSFSAIIAAMRKWILIGEQARCGVSGKLPRKPGVAKGLISVSDDFDAPLDIWG
ncbi:MAG: hypothetical protein ACLQVD_15160 [Capsulimonadaceae bacterium]